MMESLYFFIKYFRKKFHHRCFIDYPCYSFCLTWKLLFAPTHIGNMKTPTRKIAPRIIPTGQFPPPKASTKENSHPRSLTFGQFPSRKIPTRTTPTQDNFHPDNFHPGNSQMGTFLSSQLPPRIIVTQLI